MLLAPCCPDGSVGSWSCVGCECASSHPRLHPCAVGAVRWRVATPLHSKKPGFRDILIFHFLAGIAFELNLFAISVSDFWLLSGFSVILSLDPKVEGTGLLSPRNKALWGRIGTPCIAPECFCSLYKIPKCLCVCVSLHICIPVSA